MKILWLIFLNNQVKWKLEITHILVFHKNKHFALIFSNSKFIFSINVTQETLNILIMFSQESGVWGKSMKWYSDFIYV